MPRHGHRWIDILQKERGQAPMIDIAYAPTMCNHCDNAPCLAKGGDAVKKRDDGIVIIDPVKAKGRKDLVESCPYGHIWWNEELQTSADLAVRRPPARSGLAADPRPAGLPDRRDEGDQGRGRRDGAARASDEQLEVMKPEAGTKPRVYYRNLWRYSKSFIGGSVASEAGGVVDCVEGASVRLIKDGQTVARATTDNYGDFKFDKLDDNSGRYTVEVIVERPHQDARRQPRRQRLPRRDQAVDSLAYSRSLLPTSIVAAWVILARLRERGRLDRGGAREPRRPSGLERSLRRARV